LITDASVATENTKISRRRRDDDELIKNVVNAADSAIVEQPDVTVFKKSDFHVMHRSLVEIPSKNILKGGGLF
jgi:hypothetical protein